jgi:hypothetical protein
VVTGGRSKAPLMVKIENGIYYRFIILFVIPKYDPAYEITIEVLKANKR